MGAFDAIGQALAKVNIAIARGLWVTMTHYARNAAGVDLYVEIVGEEIQPIVGAANAVEECRVINIKVSTGQTGFSAATNDQEPIAAGDKWVYLGRNYFTAAPITKDVYGRTYNLKLVERKSLAS